jgi:hypothetical protein
VYASDDKFDRLNQTSVLIPITVSSVNDEPEILPIPDVLMWEDGSYTSPVPFLAEYVTDIDNELDELTVTFSSSDENVKVGLDDQGHLTVSISLDFNGVVPVTMTAIFTKVRS